MKKILFAFLILSSVNFAFAQDVPQKPLTQAEYVKMLYVLDKNPGRKDELVEAVRKRGIGFELTDGLRSLTTSKSRNDADLRRTLEEAARRKENPTAAKLPSEKEAAEVLAKSREATLAAVEEMPDFVVKQLVSRSASYAGTNNFKNLDQLIVAASYRTDGFEEYKILSINGVKQIAEKGSQVYSSAGGAASAGEFVTILSSLFKVASDTKFQLIDTDVLSGRNAVVFDFEISREKLQRGVATGERLQERITTGFKGKVWIDRKDFRVIRIETEATEIPLDFPIKSIKRYINYDWVKINDGLYLLPSISEVRIVQSESKEIYESRNIIRFKDYQKYGSEVKILDDDEEVPEEKPKP